MLVLTGHVPLQTRERNHHDLVVKRFAGLSRVSQSTSLSLRATRCRSAWSHEDGSQDLVQGEVGRAQARASISSPSAHSWRHSVDPPRPPRLSRARFSRHLLCDAGSSRWLYPCTPGSACSLVFSKSLLRAQALMIGYFFRHSWPPSQKRSAEPLTVHGEDETQLSKLGFHFLTLRAAGIARAAAICTVRPGQTCIWSASRHRSHPCTRQSQPSAGKPRACEISSRH